MRAVHIFLTGGRVVVQEGMTDQDARALVADAVRLMGKRGDLHIIGANGAMTIKTHEIEGARVR